MDWSPYIWSFNSSKVRYDHKGDDSVLIQELKFQFLKGTIRPLQTIGIIIHSFFGFNSSKVRYDPEKEDIASFLQKGFQFLKGTIRQCLSAPDGKAFESFNSSKVRYDNRKYGVLDM